MTLKDIRKYTTMEELMKLTRRQRAILYKQCLGGRSCYIQDINYGSGGFFESCFDARGCFRGPFLTDRYIQSEMTWKQDI